MTQKKNKCCVWILVSCLCLTACGNGGFSNTAAPLFKIGASVRAATVAAWQPTEEEDFSPLPEGAEAPALPQFKPKDEASFTQSYLGAVVAESMGDLERSATHYLTTLTNDPENTYLLEAAFTYQLAQGGVAEAVTLAQKMAQKGVSTPVSNLVLAAHATQKNQLQEVEAFLARAQEQSVELLQFHLARVYVALEKGAPVEQVAATLKAYDAHPSLKPYQNFHIGRVYELAGKTEQAQVFYELAQEGDPGSIFNTLQLGGLYLQQGNLEKTLETYDVFDTVKPSSTLLLDARRAAQESRLPLPFKPTLQENMAEVFFGLGTLMTSPDALLASQQMMHIAHYLAPEHPFAAFYVANLADARGAHQQAEVFYKKVPANSPAWFAAQLRLANMMFDTGRGKEAKNVLRAMVADYADHYQLYQTMGDLYYSEKAYSRAIVYYKRALASVPNPRAIHAALFFSLGASHERLGEISRAMEYLQKSLTLSPTNPVVLNYLGYMMLEHGGNVDQALLYISKALVMMPEDGAIIDSLGWAYFKKGEYAEAVILLERAAEFLPDDPSVNSHLGDVYEKLKRTQEAITHWQRALALGVEDEKELKLLKQKLAKYGVVVGQEDTENVEAKVKKPDPKTGEKK